MNWDRFRAKAAAYLKEHEDHVALQNLRRNKQLTAADLAALGDMLVASGGDHHFHWNVSHAARGVRQIRMFAGK